MVIVRYPGTKAELARKVGASIVLQARDYGPIIEPFVGAGGMLLTLAKLAPKQKFVIGERDFSMYALWNCVLECDPHFERSILKVQPTIETFKEAKALLAGDEDPDNIRCTEDSAVARLIVQQMSFSGMARAPIGGYDQSGRWKIGCRWDAKALIRKFREIAKLLDGRVTQFHGDFSMTLNNTRDGVLYVDPPYYKVGDDLYPARVDHERLAKKLELEKRPWMLSYDNDPWVHFRYQFANVKTVALRYTARRKRVERELLITSKNWKSSRTKTLLEAA
jgi:DNA adenine methylase